jgi:hypothetical protein
MNFWISGLAEPPPGLGAVRLALASEERTGGEAAPTRDRPQQTTFKRQKTQVPLPRKETR